MTLTEPVAQQIPSILARGQYGHCFQPADMDKRCKLSTNLRFNLYFNHIGCIKPSLQQEETHSDVFDQTLVQASRFSLKPPAWLVCWIKDLFDIGSLYFFPLLPVSVLWIWQLLCTLNSLKTYCSCTETFLSGCTVCFLIQTDPRKTLWCSSCVRCTSRHEYARATFLFHSLLREIKSVF